MNKIAVFASGSGTNAQNIAEFFKSSNEIKVACLLTNNPKAYVLERFKGKDVEALVFNRDEFYNSTKVPDYLADRNIDYIVLAGFLWLVPVNLIQAYSNKIINIHPALLPKFGGKGMYGMRVHKAVVEAGEVETGITIHYVNERYDEGNIIFQKNCTVSEKDSPEQVAEKVHQLEYECYPKIIEDVILANK